MNQHVIDYYRLVAKNWRGSDQAQWASYQIADLTADQRVADIKSGKIREAKVAEQAINAMFRR